MRPSIKSLQTPSLIQNSRLAQMLFRITWIMLANGQSWQPPSKGQTSKRCHVGLVQGGRGPGHGKRKDILGGEVRIRGGHENKTTRRIYQLTHSKTEEVKCISFYHQPVLPTFP